MVIALRGKGLTYAAIGRELGVTKQAIESALRRRGLSGRIRLNPNA